MPKTVIICGDRHWKDWDYMERELLERLEDGDIVREGGAAGADRMARNICEERGKVTIKTYKAKWRSYGRAAGPIRNKTMLEEDGLPNEVWAFHPNLGESKGTKNMVEFAVSAGVPVTVFTYHECKYPIKRVAIKEVEGLLGRSDD